MDNSYGGRTSQCRNLSQSDHFKPGDPIVHLSDVADAQDMYDRPDSYARINGQRGIVFSVLSQAGANILDTIGSVDRELRASAEGLRATWSKVSESVRFEQLYPGCSQVVKDSLIEAIVLVLLVLFVFLKNWRSIFIVATSIPVSVVGTFIGMYLVGYSINVLSLADLHSPSG